MEKKKYFNNVNSSAKNAAMSGRMLRRSDSKSINLGLDVNVDPIHIIKEEVSAQMEDCAVDVSGPTLEVEGQDIVIPVFDKDQTQMIKAGKVKMKFSLGGGRMNQTATKSACEMMGGFLNMISDMWDQKQTVKEEEKEPEEKDGFDPVE